MPGFRFLALCSLAVSAVSQAQGVPPRPFRSSLPKAPQTQKNPKDQPPLNVYVDCNFPVSVLIDCDDFKTQFFNQVPGVVSVDSATNAEIVMNLTDAVADPTDTNFLFTNTFIFQTTTLKESGMAVTVPDSLKTTNDYYNILIPAASAAVQAYQAYALALGQPGVTPAPPDIWDVLAKKPLYVSVGLNGLFAKNGSGAETTSTLQVPTSVQITYLPTDFKWRADLTGSYEYQKATIPGPNNTKYSASDSSLNTALDGIYQFTKHIDGAVMNNTEQDNGANVRYQEQLGVGAEWCKYCVRTTQTQSFSVRAAIGFMTETLVQANYLGHLGERLPGALAEVNYYWVTDGDKLVLATTASYDQYFKYAKNLTVADSSSATYQVNRALQFNVTAGYEYSPVSMTYPGNPDFSNPLATGFLTNPPGSSYSFTGGIKFTFGPTVNVNNDTRWH